MLVNGVWEKNWDPVQKQDKEGRFLRQTSAFRERIAADTVAAMQAGAYQQPRYTLYAAYICPWATRTLIARSLLGLEQHIAVKIVDPRLSDYGWRFSDFPGSSDPAGVAVGYIHELYTRTDPHYSGRATVPALWDNLEGRIINNESVDILSILNEDLKPLHGSDIDLSPEAFKSDIDAFNERIYHRLNNGVYRAGFATTELAYREAYQEIFECLDELELHFAGNRFAMGEALSESDLRLFVTLVRFDVAYFSLFKTNKRRISDYPALSDYLQRLLQIPAFSDNTRVDHIKAGYYSIKALNPNGIVPAGPALPWFSLLQPDTF